ncbi:MAG: hypothetical protein ABIH99_03535 [Candidatus Micrarchaeota archaeon]
MQFYSVKDAFSRKRLFALVFVFSLFILLLSSTASAANLCPSKIATRISASSESDAKSSTIHVEATLRYLDEATGKSGYVPRRTVYFQLCPSSCPDDEFPCADQAMQKGCCRTSGSTQTATGCPSGQHACTGNDLSCSIGCCYDSALTKQTAVTNEKGLAETDFTFDLSNSPSTPELIASFKGDDLYLPSSTTSLGGTISKYGLSITACIPLFLIFGFLAMAMYAAGKNPFGAFDFSGPAVARARSKGVRGAILSSVVSTKQIAKYVGKKTGISGKLAALKAKAKEKLNKGMDKLGGKPEGMSDADWKNTNAESSRGFYRNLKTTLIGGKGAQKLWQKAAGKFVPREISAAERGLSLSGNAKGKIGHGLSLAGGKPKTPAERFNLNLQKPKSSLAQRGVVGAMKGILGAGKAIGAVARGVGTAAKGLKTAAQFASSGRMQLDLGDININKKVGDDLKGTRGTQTAPLQPKDTVQPASARDSALPKITPPSQRAREFIEKVLGGLSKWGVAETGRPLISRVSAFTIIGLYGDLSNRALSRANRGIGGKEDDPGKLEKQEETLKKDLKVLLDKLKQLDDKKTLSASDKAAREKLQEKLAGLTDKLVLLKNQIAAAKQKNEEAKKKFEQEMEDYKKKKADLEEKKAKYEQEKATVEKENSAISARNKEVEAAEAAYNDSKTKLEQVMVSIKQVDVETLLDYARQKYGEAFLKEVYVDSSSLMLLLSIGKNERRKEFLDGSTKSVNRRDTVVKEIDNAIAAYDKGKKPADQIGSLDKLCARVGCNKEELMDGIVKTKKGNFSLSASSDNVKNFLKDEKVQNLLSVPGIKKVLWKDNVTVSQDDILKHPEKWFANNFEGVTEFVRDSYKLGVNETIKKARNGDYRHEIQGVKPEFVEREFKKESLLDAPKPPPGSIGPAPKLEQTQIKDNTADLEKQIKDLKDKLNEPTAKGLSDAEKQQEKQLLDAIKEKEYQLGTVQNRRILAEGERALSTVADTLDSSSKSFEDDIAKQKKIAASPLSTDEEVRAAEKKLDLYAQEKQTASYEERAKLQDNRSNLQSEIDFISKAKNEKNDSARASMIENHLKEQGITGDVTLNEMVSEYKSSLSKRASALENEIAKIDLTLLQQKGDNPHIDEELKLFRSRESQIMQALNNGGSSKETLNNMQNIAKSDFEVTAVLQRLMHEPSLRKEAGEEYNKLLASHLESMNTAEKDVTAYHCTKQLLDNIKTPFSFRQSFIESMNNTSVSVRDVQASIGELESAQKKIELTTSILDLVGGKDEPNVASLLQSTSQMGNAASHLVTGAYLNGIEKTILEHPESVKSGELDNLLSDVQRYTRDVAAESDGHGAFDIAYHQSKILDAIARVKEQEATKPYNETVKEVEYMKDTIDRLKSFGGNRDDIEQLEKTYKAKLDTIEYTQSSAISNIAKKVDGVNQKLEDNWEKIKVAQDEYGTASAALSDANTKINKFEQEKADGHSHPADQVEQYNKLNNSVPSLKKEVEETKANVDSLSINREILQEVNVSLNTSLQGGINRTYGTESDYSNVLGQINAYKEQVDDSLLKSFQTTSGDSLTRMDNMKIDIPDSRPEPLSITKPKSAEEQAKVSEEARAILKELELQMPAREEMKAEEKKPEEHIAPEAKAPKQPERTAPIDYSSYLKDPEVVHYLKSEYNINANDPTFANQIKDVFEIISPNDLLEEIKKKSKKSKKSKGEKDEDES